MFIIDYNSLDFDLFDINDLDAVMEFEILNNDAINNDCGLINQIELLFNLDFDLIDNNCLNQTVIDLIELFNSEKQFYKAFECIIIQMTYNYIENLLKHFFNDISYDLETNHCWSEFYYDIIELSNKDFDIMDNKEKTSAIMTYIQNNIKLDEFLDFDFIQTFNLSIRFI